MFIQKIYLILLHWKLLMKFFSKLMSILQRFISYLSVFYYKSSEITVQDYYLVI